MTKANYSLTNDHIFHCVFGVGFFASSLSGDTAQATEQATAQATEQATAQATEQATAQATKQTHITHCCCASRIFSLKQKQLADLSGLCLDDFNQPANAG